MKPDKTDDKVFVKPKEGLRVVNPDTGEALPAKGMKVTPSIYWARRVRDGDVTIGTTGSDSNRKSGTKE